MQKRYFDKSENVEKAKSLYLGGKSMKTVAEEIGCSRGAVWCLLRRENVKARPRGAVKDGNNDS